MSSYRGRSIGRLIHFLDWYCGSYVAYEAQFRGGEVHFHGAQIVSKVTWSDKFGEADVPIFEFVGPNKEHYERNQFLRCEDAQKDSFYLADERKELHEDAVKVFSIVQRKAYQSACIFYQGCQEHRKTGDTSRLRLFTAKMGANEYLMFEGFSLYFWHEEMGCWLRAS